jgi:hypothetical protein
MGMSAAATETATAPAGTPPAGAATSAPAGAAILNPPGATPPAVRDAGGPPPAAPPAPAAPVLGRGGTALPPESVAQRVDRERRKLLREEYGTDDAARVEQIRAQRKADAARLQGLAEAEDARKREAMTAQQRLEADLAKERERAVTLETRLKTLEEERVMERQSSQLHDLASKHVDPSLVDWALIRFQRYVQSAPVDQIKRLTPRAIERWFEKFVSENPKAKREAAAPTPAPTPDQAPAKVAPAPEKPPRRVPLATSTAARGGAPTPRAPAAQAGAVAGKTIKPGLPNSMTKAEVNAYLATKGMRPY